MASDSLFFENNKLNNSLLFGNNSLNLKMGSLSEDFSSLLMKGIEKNLCQKQTAKVALPPALYETLAERFETYETLIS